MIKTFLILILISFFAGCQPPAKKAAPATLEKQVNHFKYDLTKPQVLKMPAILDEISGIAFNKGNPDTIYAEQDEEGRLFYFPSATLDVKHQKFGKKGDYEDIAICNGTVFMLRSDGTLFSFPLNQTVKEEIESVQETADLLPKGEYEGLYADEVAGTLYVVCKSCRDDNDAKTVSGYILQINPGKTMEMKGNFQLNVKDIASKLNEKKLAFKPAALTRNTTDNKWYILSSVNKLLVVTNDQWVIQDIYPLDPALFTQPEGIAFDRNNDLYISNERGDGSNGTVLKFPVLK